MKNKLNLILLTIISIMLTACASTTTTLDRAAVEKNKISKIHLISSENLGFEKSTSGATSGAIAGGLLGVAIGASIDSNINAKRKEAFAPILNSVADFNIRNEFSEKLKGLSGRAFEPELTVNSSSIDEKNKDDNYGLNTLVITSDFLLSADRKSVLGTANISLKTSAEGKTYGQLLFANSAGSFNEEKKEEISQFWIDNPEKLKDLIDLTMSQLVETISFEINTGSKKED